MNHMEYRKLPHGGERISILGLGTSSIQESSEKEIEEIIVCAMEQGINFFDMASAEAKPFEAYGRAVGKNRENVYFQIHFGTNYETAGRGAPYRIVFSYARAGKPRAGYGHFRYADVQH